MYVLERVQHRVPEEALRVSAGTHEAPAPCTPPPALHSHTSWLPWPGCGAMSQPGLAWPVLQDGPV